MDHPGVTMGFNPRPHAAGDCGPANARQRAPTFQSTPAHGGRPSRPCRKAGDRRCFNPRPHAAGDGRLTSLKLIRRHGFNPRPHAAGDLAGIGHRQHVEAVSIHARTRRATCRPWQSEAASAFQSTPARGGRRPGSIPLYASRGRFNPRPHAAGDRPGAATRRQQRSSFNPRPHAAGDRSATLHAGRA